MMHVSYNKPAVTTCVTQHNPRRPGFTPSSVQVGCVVDKVAIEQIFLLVLRVPHVFVIPL
jgi:hypothetical protein